MHVASVDTTNIPCILIPETSGYAKNQELYAPESHPDKTCPASWQSTFPVQMCRDWHGIPSYLAEDSRTVRTQDRPTSK
ncbi:hypothetical protein EXIGLDRAFT_726354 [Exidia glandulosa HHB12029]|uniref:Uncharacterized protein n=1 Tax=Exidia glandulosa HHB12029 TaxID=1314781 RepID=A0A165DRI4_EXIGL|nr:hypothetical protein EXIGLDRAFT_726354 [Exidia glandulosa HHB12029]